MFLAVAAGVIGGTPLAGGSGTIIGGLIGAVVLGVLNDGFTLIGINAFTFNIILGAAILGAMLFNIHVTRLARRVAAMSIAPSAAGGRHRQAFRRRHRAGRRVADAAAGRDPRHPWRQRRRQVDADEDPHRLRDTDAAAGCSSSGREVALHSVDQARALGIECVYQDLALANSLSVYHNMFLNREIVHRGPFRLLNNRAMRQQAARTCWRDRRAHSVGRSAGGAAVGRPAPGHRGGARGELRCAHPAAGRTAGGDGRARGRR